VQVEGSRTAIEMMRRGVVEPRFISQSLSAARHIGRPGDWNTHGRDQLMGKA